VAALCVIFGVTALVVPDSAVTPASVSLVKVEVSEAVDYEPNVVWILALGSDARPGEDLLRSRADAIQLIGVNLKAGTAVGIGVPRDSYVNIPGHGRGKINSAMTYGGPQLMADAVGELIGIHPAYVVTAGFVAFRTLVGAIGGVSVRSERSYFDQEFSLTVKKGMNEFGGPKALAFARGRYALPRGDFDRSANQQALLRAILSRVRDREQEPGFMETGVRLVLEHLDTNLAPPELYRLARAVMNVDPQKFVACVLDGSIATVGEASVVFPDRAQARRLGADARDDARLDRGCWTSRATTPQCFGGSSEPPACCD